MKGNKKNKWKLKPAGLKKGGRTWKWSKETLAVKTLVSWHWKSRNFMSDKLDNIYSFVQTSLFLMIFLLRPSSNFVNLCEDIGILKFTNRSKLVPFCKESKQAIIVVIGHLLLPLSGSPFLLNRPINGPNGPLNILSWARIVYKRIAVWCSLRDTQKQRSWSWSSLLPTGHQILIFSFRSSTFDLQP